MKKALDKTELKERFTEHDLRAKVASDISLEHAQILLGHSSAELTAKTYKRNAEKVLPTLTF